MTIFVEVKYAKRTHLIAMLFFSDANIASLRTREALDEMAKRGSQGFTLKVRGVDYESKKEFCKQYGVYGVPVTLVFLNEELRGRHYGEISSEEFKIIFNSYSGFEGEL